MRMLRTLLCLLALHATPATVPLHGQQAPLPDALRSIIDRPAVRRASWGIEVRDMASNAVLVRHNADRLFIPASNQKLIVAAAAAHYLPHDFRYSTTLESTGTVADGTLSGDLVVRGTGDPTISGRYDRGMLAVWEMLADSLLARGIRRVDGGIIADESHWDGEYVRGDWEVYDVLWWYAAPVGALGFNDNSIDFSISAAQPGQPATITWQPQTSFFTLINRSTTGAARSRNTLDFTRVPGTDTIIAYGSFPADAARSTQYFAVADPARYAATVFMETLERKGVQVGSRDVRVIRGATAHAPAAPPQPRTQVIVTHRSVPLPQLIAPVLQTSQNWFAEQLLKTLGREVGGTGSWQSGLDVERRFLIDVVRIDSTAFRLRDASGLSAGNLITPSALVDLARYIARETRMEPARAALPVSGAGAGSLRSRLPELPGRVTAKTGSISNVDSLTGFLVTDSGRTLVFSILVNGSGQPSSAMRPVLDDIVRALARAF